MNILVDIFKNFSTFSLYAPGVETNMDLNDLRSSGLTARKRIETVISRTVFDELLKEKEDSPLMEALRAAMANMTMANQIIFDSVNRRKSEVNVYKYELEAMKRSYTENYCNAIDTLVQLLSEPTEGEIAELWRKTPYYPILERCEIKTMDQMDAIYPIDASYLYFFRTVPLQKETLDEVMSVYFEKLTDDNRERIRPILLLALVKKTIAKSLRRFDILEFPSTIRNLFDDSHAARSGKDESSAIFALADRLDREAEELLSNADTLLSSETVSDFCSNSAYNHPDDNIIMLP
ncbi:hypothetical protein J5A54_01545 [Prevotella melaninogenica]|uniref:hypothetical protein n=1 Tax=Prevotella melaninogenica TaxID=28132 RepID=UPI001BAD296F|nr:hypothetical protein [Prevotella melaninogenica]QUB63419.1 hypothetical protein J5A54_01545 [Prevotella melaninogenica]